MTRIIPVLIITALAALGCEASSLEPGVVTSTKAEALAGALVRCPSDNVPDGSCDAECSTTTLGMCPYAAPEPVLWCAGHVHGETETVQGHPSMCVVCEGLARWTRLDCP